MWKKKIDKMLQLIEKLEQELNFQNELHFLQLPNIEWFHDQLILGNFLVSSSVVFPSNSKEGVPFFNK